MTTLVGVLLGSGVLIPTAALVVDVGSIYVERGELQNGADAAAVAVAKGCVAGKCVNGLDLVAQTSSAKKMANANASDKKTAVTQVCGKWAGLPACPPAPKNLTACEGPTPSGNYVEIRVRTETKTGSSLLPPTLARTFAGKSDYDGTSVGACARATANDICVTAKNATYRHTFNGPAGTATITADSPLCQGQEQPFSLVSYTAPDAAFAVPQFMYDYETKSITAATRSLTFQIDVPACYTQVDFVVGTEIYNPLTGTQYGDRKVGSSGAPGNMSSGPDAWYNGGNRPCSPRPTASLTSQSDGMRVTLGNGSTANIDAAFKVTSGDGDQFVRVAKGETKTIKILPTDATQVTVIDNTFRTTTGKWRKP